MNKEIEKDRRLPEGKTCACCVSVNRCRREYSISIKANECLFYPSRFMNSSTGFKQTNR